MQPTAQKPTEQGLIIAGEASSALYALRILEKFKSSHPGFHFFGVGSRDMEAEGFECIGRSEDMAVVGLQEVLAHYSDIKVVFNKLVEEAEKRRPKFILLLDYPDFNLRLAKKLKPLGIPIIYYISPQLWAWRTGRIKIVQKFIDKMLVLFPFEVDFYKKHNVDCDFVGHPLLDELDPEKYSETARNELRSRYGFKSTEKVLGLMPGSRPSELKLNLESQLKAAEILYKKDPSLKIYLAVAPSFDISELQSFMPESVDFPVVLVKREPMEMIHIADVVLTASGTATVMVGLMNVPMVIMYKMKPFTAWLAKKLVKGPRNFGMINLILGEEVCKELFQEEASPENMAEELSKLLYQDDKHSSTKQKLERTATTLGDRGATDRVVEHLESFL